MTAANSSPSTNPKLEEWLRRLEALADQVKAWSAEKNWIIDAQPAVIHEKAFGAYSVPHVRVIRPVPKGEIHVEPVALRVVNADGRVDIWAYPTMNRVRLVGGEGGRWLIYTDSNVPIRSEWSRELWYQLVEDLLAAP